MHQHWVPASYLRAWFDPASEHPQNPYVWRFSKDGSEVRRKSPENLFHERDMYTLTDKDGNCDLTIEQGLSKLEDMFERLRRDKIMRCETLTDEDKATLFLFVATARFRTPRSRDHWERQLGEAVELGDRIKANVELLSAEQKAALKNETMSSGGQILQIEDLRLLAEQPLQRMLPEFTRIEAGLLSYMTPTIICTSDNSGFITSDAPVVWFDPESHKIPAFYRNPAFGSPTIEVTMPITPSRMLLLTHGRTREDYIQIPEIGTSFIDEINRRTRFHCDDHFVCRSNDKKDIWFELGTPPPG
jgi:hypothetical protein